MQKPLVERRSFHLPARLTITRGRPDRLRAAGTRVSGQTGQWLAVRWSDDLVRSRTAAHAAIILLIGLMVVFTSHSLLALPQREGSLTNQPLLFPYAGPAAGPVPAAPSDAALAPSTPLLQDDSIVMRAAVPFTIVPAERPRQEITTYLVKPGDTIFGIAYDFNIQPETIMWANGRFVEDNPDLLSVGQELVILPVDGVYHQVGKGDTVEKVAATFKTDPAAIINFPLNNLDAENPQLAIGQWLVVPGGSKPYVARQVVAYAGPAPADAQKGSGSFGWPASGSISQGYWGRHRAIDVAAWEGAPVLAADSGYVVAAGWDDSGYGRMLLIDHGNGFQSLYAHLKVYYVKVGDSVAKGEQIGEMGTTGNASGPHLHLEIRQGEVQRNPLGFLP